MLSSEQIALLRRNLRYLMRERGESANYVAGKCDIKASTLSRFLAGRIDSPRASTLVSLAKFYNYTVEDLLGKDVSVLPKLRPPHQKRAPLIPMITGLGALIVSGQHESWKDYPELDIECEVEGWVPMPPDYRLRVQVEKSSDIELFAYRTEDQAMEPVFSSRDLLYVLSRKVRKPQNGEYVLVRKFNPNAVIDYESDAFLNMTEFEQNDFVKLQSADFVVRKLTVSPTGEMFLFSTWNDWPGSRSIRLNLGLGDESDQILGVIVGKYASL